MRISTFIGFSSLLICGWLGMAFFREVPTGNYPVIEGALGMKSISGSGSSLVATTEDRPFEP